MDRSKWLAVGKGGKVHGKNYITSLRNSNKRDNKSKINILYKISK